MTATKVGVGVSLEPETVHELDALTIQMQRRDPAHAYSRSNLIAAAVDDFLARLRADESKE